MITAVPARLDGPSSQAVFDTLLRSLAEPGTIRSLPAEVVPYGPHAMVLALADVDIRVHVDAAFGPEAAEAVRRATGARLVGLDRADLVALRDGRSEALSELRTGTPFAPEDGAKVSIRVAGIGVSRSALRLCLTGPGVDGRRFVGVDGLVAAAATMLGQGSGRYPAGYDTWLVSDDGSVIGVPRSTTVTIERGDR